MLSERGSKVCAVVLSVTLPVGRSVSSNDPSAPDVVVAVPIETAAPTIGAPPEVFTIPATVAVGVGAPASLAAHPDATNDGARTSASIERGRRMGVRVTGVVQVRMCQLGT